ncbi:MAG: cytochrome c [Burkholderiales bacterium]
MKISKIGAALIGVVLAAMSAMVLAADKVDLGKKEFEANCAGCHGVKAKGDGPFKPYLNKIAPDLTVLTKNNGGAFPFARVYETIDGTSEASVHGTRDMPIWGTVYKIKAGEYYGDVDYVPDYFVRSRVLALIDYINRLQVK